jgi:hypothetical protein
MIPIKPAEIRLILEATDRLGVHREGVVISLAREGAGRVALAAGGAKLEITAPAELPVSDWLQDLPELVASLDISRVKKVDLFED